MNSEVTIVGGGIVGGSLAVALSRAGVSVTLVDARGAEGASAWRADAPAYDQRIYALRPGSKQFLESCEIWQHVVAHRVAPVYRMEVTGDDGRSRLTFDAYSSHLSELAVIVESANLQAAVMRTLQDCALVNIVSGKRCVGLEADESGASVVLENGPKIRSQLVVGADGSNSAVREFAGIAADQSPYGHSGVVANFATEKSHGGTAWQWFRPDGVLALLPLPGRQVSMVWSTRQEHANELVALGNDELALRVTRAAQQVLGEMKQTGKAAAFPLRLMRAASVTGDRLALVGDAAHNVHPLSGQGLNLGLADAQSLSTNIAARGPDQCGSRAVLARYRRSRAEEVAAMQFTTDGLHRLFQSSAPGVAWLRNTGLRLTEHFTPLKRLLVKHAAGSAV